MTIAILPAEEDLAFTSLRTICFGIGIRTTTADGIVATER